MPGNEVSDNALRANHLKGERKDWWWPSNIQVLWFIQDFIQNWMNSLLLPTGVTDCNFHFVNRYVCWYESCFAKVKNEHFSNCGQRWIAKHWNTWMKGWDAVQTVIQQPLCHCGWMFPVANHSLTCGLHLPALSQCERDMTMSAAVRVCMVAALLIHKEPGILDHDSPSAWEILTQISLVWSVTLPPGPSI